MRSIPRLACLFLLLLAAIARSQPADTSPPTVSTFAFQTATSTEGTFQIVFSGDRRHFR